MSASVKDPFEILADELTLIRRDMDRLQRTSLDKAEAKALNAHLTGVLARMQAVAAEAPGAVRSALKADRDRMAHHAVQSATEAAQMAVESLSERLDIERARFAQAAGEARREAWLHFGGFWVWLAAMLATGALLGALAMAWIGGTIAARDFGDYPGIYCNSAGGQRITSSTGSTFCAVPIKGPE